MFQRATLEARRSPGRDSADDFDDGVGGPPERPRRTSRSDRSPRPNNIHVRMRRGSSDLGKEIVVSDDENLRREAVTLRQRLSEIDQAKTQLQTQLQRQDAEMAKQDRYIAQLLEEKGGLDSRTMENIARELEKSSLVKKTRKEVAQLRAKVKQREDELAAVKAMQVADYVVSLAEEKEALAIKVEQLTQAAASPVHSNTARHEGNGSASGSGRDGNSPELLAELKRLRKENVTMRKETARLRAEMDMAVLQAESSNNKTTSADAPHTEHQASRSSNAPDRTEPGASGGGGGVAKARPQDPFIVESHHNSGDSIMSDLSVDDGDNLRPFSSRSRSREPSGRSERRGGGRAGERHRPHHSEQQNNDKPQYQRGQAVLCQRVGSEKWVEATVESAQVVAEGSSGHTYTIRHTKSNRMEAAVQEGRLRASSGPDNSHLAAPRAGSGTHRGDCGTPSDATASPPSRLEERHGETIIRASRFTPGERVYARSNSGAEWVPAEVLERNSDGTYHVELSQGGVEPRLHAVMIRKKNGGGGGADESGQANVGSGPGGDLGNDPEFLTRLLAQENAEMTYARMKNELVAKAQNTLLHMPPVLLGDEVLAKREGSPAWEPGHVTRVWAREAEGDSVVMGGEDIPLYFDVEFGAGDLQEKTPLIFVRLRDAGRILGSDDEADCLIEGDPVLALTSHGGAHSPGGSGGGGGGGGHEFWYAGRVMENITNTTCSIVFAHDNLEPTRVHLSNVRDLFPRHGLEVGDAGSRGNQRSSQWGPGGSCRSRTRPTIPGKAPNPTKPVRAKKCHRGDLVMACIPGAKEWSPAVVTGARGQGKYSLEWADGDVEDALLFMYMVPLLSPPCPLPAEMTSATPTTTAPTAAAIANVSPATNTSSAHPCKDKPPTEQAESPRQGLRKEGGKGKPAETQSVRSARPESPGSMSLSGSEKLHRVLRIRQKRLVVGEAVLARRPNNDNWQPGVVEEVEGGGSYTVAFSGGSKESGLSFAYIRTIDETERKENREEEEEENGAGGCRPANREFQVDDKVYVLQPGEGAKSSVEDRKKWRNAVVVGARPRGYFTVQYTEEEGMPREARVPAARLRFRAVLRQKAFQRGDIVLAQNGEKGWQIGGVVENLGAGKYMVSFGDGSGDRELSFFHMRRLVDPNDPHHSSTSEIKQPPNKRQKPIRQKRFKAQDVGLAKDQDNGGKWAVMRVLKAHPEGIYDIEFLAGGGKVVCGISFTCMRHLKAFNNNSLNCGDGSGGGGIGNSAPDPSGETSDHEDMMDHQYEMDYSKNSGRFAQGAEEGRQERFKVRQSVLVQKNGAGGGAWLDATIVRCLEGGCYDVLFEDGDVWEAVHSHRIRTTDNSRAKEEEEEKEETGNERKDTNSAQENNYSAPRAAIRGSPNSVSSPLGGRGVKKRKLEPGMMVAAKREGEAGWSPALVTECLGEGNYVLSFDGQKGGDLEKVHFTKIRWMEMSKEHGRLVAKSHSNPDSPSLSIRSDEDEPPLVNPGSSDQDEPAEGGGGRSRSQGAEERGSYGDKRETGGGGRGGNRVSRRTRAGHGEGSTGSWDDDQYGYDEREEGTATARPAARTMMADRPSSGVGPASKTRGPPSPAFAAQQQGELTAAATVQLAAVSFNLALSASAARRTAPSLVLAVGEQGSTREECLRGEDAAAEGRLVTGLRQPGSCRPSWKGKVHGNGEGVFMLSLEGLYKPELYLALLDQKVGGGAGAAAARNNPILAEASVLLQDIGVGSLSPSRGSNSNNDGSRGGRGLRWMRGSAGGGGRRSISGVEVKLQGGAGLAVLELVKAQEG